MTTTTTKAEGTKVAELKNEVSNLKHDYTIVSAQRNELLAACKAMADYAEQRWPSFKHGNMANLMRAAIAKAEGKQ